MENALFLSNDNQRHLLEMKGSFDGQRAPRVSLLRNSSPSNSKDEKVGCIPYEGNHFEGLSGLGLTSQESFTQLDVIRSSAGPTQCSADSLLLKLRAESSKSGMCGRTSRKSDRMVRTSGNSGMDGQDPFVFDEDDCEPSKWDVMSGSSNKPLSQGNRQSASRFGFESHPVLVASQQESNDVGYRHSQEASCSSAVDDDNKSNLLADCLLTAVKVLMNLTNDNPDGCRQIATCGGLEILSSLIAGHFSSFRTCLPHSDDARDNISSSKSSPKSSTPLTDRELDFIVALLGLLVNLVEKDSRNRSRLTAATVSLPNPEGSASKDQSDIISLLCSIFLANQSNTDATREETYLSWNKKRTAKAAGPVNIAYSGLSQWWIAPSSTLAAVLNLVRNPAPRPDWRRKRAVRSTAEMNDPTHVYHWYSAVAAVDRCDGVFHVAAAVDFEERESEEVKARRVTIGTRAILQAYGAVNSSARSRAPAAVWPTGIC
ncbi:WAPL (Wings apart-like protein regulation of heterochromatin) protein [Striga hermonthica]|uniref:WAPL (Wings apart-like protein regulation of heterochromatin) protein n=1 Tax=Striga hermonthica TaxID=68872 RepID=A0A9N7R017_STRHE|nr:WAPL (Wings apart-like protein regulation of heterochromatin) protein [Striga hermonthica]